jgi:hypothetical protein
VKCTGLAGNALTDQTRVLVNQDAHADVSVRVSELIATDYIRPVLFQDSIII